MLELAHKNLETVIVTVFRTFGKLKERFIMLSKEMDYIYIYIYIYIIIFIYKIIYLYIKLNQTTMFEIKKLTDETNGKLGILEEKIS